MPPGPKLFISAKKSGVPSYGPSISPRSITGGGPGGGGGGGGGPGGGGPYYPPSPPSPLKLYSGPSQSH